jgi:hypothetical protein
MVDGGKCISISPQMLLLGRLPFVSHGANDNMTKEEAMTPTEKGMTGLVYILAGSAQQAVEYAREKKIDKNLIVYVHEPYRLWGINGKGKKLILYGTYYKRHDSHDIIAEAVSRGWEVV